MTLFSRRSQVCSFHSRGTTEHNPCLYINMSGESRGDILIIAVTAAPTTSPGDFSWRQARHKAVPKHCFDLHAATHRVGFIWWKKLPKV